MKSKHRLSIYPNQHMTVSSRCQPRMSRSSSQKNVFLGSLRPLPLTRHDSWSSQHTFSTSINQSSLWRYCHQASRLENRCKCNSRWLTLSTKRWQNVRWRSMEASLMIGCLKKLGKLHGLKKHEDQLKKGLISYNTAMFKGLDIVI